MLFSLDPQVQLEFGYIQSSHQESSNKDDQQVYPVGRGFKKNYFPNRFGKQNSGSVGIGSLKFSKQF